MSQTSLRGDDRWNPSVAQRISQRVLSLTPYAALAVIAGIVFGTLSTHPF